MISAVNNIHHINTMDTIIFTRETFKRTKTPKALVIHLVNEMTEILQKVPETVIRLTIISEDQFSNYIKIPN